MAAGTIYNYFNSKEDLLAAHARTDGGRFLSAGPWNALSRTPIQDVLRGAIRDYIEMLFQNRELIAAVAPEIIADRKLRQGNVEQIFKSLAQRFAPVLNDLAFMGYVRPLNVWVVRPAISGAIIGSLLAQDAYKEMGLPERSRRNSWSTN